jgi:hypothetical protein
VPPSRYPRGGEVGRRRNGLNVCVQHRRECVADRVDYRVICLGIPVELVRRAEELVGLGHGHVRAVSQLPCVIEMEEDRMPWYLSQALMSLSVSGYGLRSSSTCSAERYAPYLKLRSGKRE